MGIMGILWNLTTKEKKSGEEFPAPAVESGEREASAVYEVTTRFGPTRFHGDPIDFPFQSSRPIIP